MRFRVYFGKVCVKHPELKGERRLVDGNCCGCHNRRNREYRSENPELFRERYNQWLAANKEYQKQRCRDWHQKNREHANASRRELHKRSKNGQAVE